MEKIYKGEIQRLLPIFQAMTDGKTIQTKNGNGWIDIDGDEDGLNLDSLIDYQDCFRIKPESKYRPFANTEECWNEMKKHQPIGWIKGKVDGLLYLITAVVSKNDIRVDGVFLSLDCIEQSYTFADGTPFGIKVEE